MSNEFPKDFLWITKQVLKMFNGCSKDFHMISTGFPKDFQIFQMIVFGIHSEFHGISKDFHMILIGFPKGSPIIFKGQSSDSMDFHRFSTEDVDMISNEFSKELPHEFERIPFGFHCDLHGFAMSFQIITKSCPQEFIKIPFGLKMDLQWIYKGIPKDAQRIPKGFPGDL